MINKIKITLITFLILSWSNLLIAENNFFKEGKKNIMRKNMKFQNFYFREV